MGNELGRLQHGYKYKYWSELKFVRHASFYPSLRTIIFMRIQ